MSSAALQSALFSADSVPAFVPSAEWAPILPGQTVPPGLWMRMDISTGTRFARLMPKEGESQGAGGSIGAIGTGDAGPRSPIGVRDDEFDESEPADGDIRTTDDFFRLFGDAFERNAKFSKRGPVPRLGHARSDDDEVTAVYGRHTQTDHDARRGGAKPGSQTKERTDSGNVHAVMPARRGPRVALTGVLCSPRLASPRLVALLPVL